MPADLRAHALVGRATELAEVEAALAAAVRGEGGLLLVTGEAGVGKSRLLTEVQARARGLGATVLSGRAAPGGGSLRAVSEAVLDGWRGRPFPESPALRPFRAALARLVPGWAEPGAPAAAPDASLVLAEGLLALFATSYDGPVVLALEDLHAADPETLDLLDRLSAGLSARPVLVAAQLADRRADPAPSLDGPTKNHGPGRPNAGQTSRGGRGCGGHPRADHFWPIEGLEALVRPLSGQPFAGACVDSLLSACTMREELCPPLRPELRTESRSNSHPDSRFAGKKVHFIGIGGCGMAGPGAHAPRRRRDRHRLRPVAKCTAFD